MKTESKAIIVSVVVLAVCLAAVGGVTYSWFSDTEQSDVDVSTGTLSVETSDYKLTDVRASEVLEEETSLPANISLDNVVANREYTIEYNVSFSQSVEAIYRVVTEVTNIDEGQEDYIITSISAIDLSNQQSADLSQWTHVAAGSDKEYYIVVTIETTIEYGNGLDASTYHGFDISIVNEIYQGDAFSSDSVTSVVSDGENEISVYDQNEDSTAISATISFTGGTGGASTNQNLNVSTTSPDDYTVSDGSMALAGINVESSNGGSALAGIETKLSFLIDGEYQESDITIYHGTTVFTPDDLDVTNDTTAETTTVSFTTDEGFSAYFVTVMPEAKVGETSYLKLQDALDAATAGSTVTLLKDVTGGVVIDDADNLTIDLNGKTLDSGTANTALNINNGIVASIKNGTLVGMYYGLALQNTAKVVELNCTAKATYSNAVYLRDQSSIDRITGGVYHGYMITEFDDYQRTLSGTFGLYIGSNAIVGTISGGEFQGTSASFRNYGTIESVTGGKFMNPLIDDSNSTFSDVNELVVFYNNAPKSVTGGIWFNQAGGKIALADGYAFSQTSESVSYDGVTCHVKPSVSHSGTYYYYEVTTTTA